MNAFPFVIDCDTGRDDALAIWAALALDMPLAGIIASYGNTSVENVVDNTARVLALAGHDDLPLLAGVAMPGRRHRGFEDIVIPRQKVAGNGLCNVILAKSGRTPTAAQEPQKMAQWLSGIAARHGGSIHYVITGPATNCAAICAALGNDAHRIISGITMMGGKFSPLWDSIPGADFNLACDPFAAHEILARRFSVRFVPMNATWPVLLTLAEIEALRGTTPVAAAARDLMIAYCRNFAPEPVFRFHDPCAVMALREPALFKSITLDICLDEGDADFGRLRKGGAFTASIFESDEKIRALFLSDILEALGLQRATG